MKNLAGPGQQRLENIRRKAVSASQQEWVRTEPLDCAGPAPLLVRPAVDGVDLAAWAGNNREFIEGHLLRHGGILFRDFAIKAATQFERFITAVSRELMAYRDQSSPRSQVSESIYTSTDHPADQSILPHNENSYSFGWPLKIFFCCLTPARQGGETPVVDCRRVLRRIDPTIREVFLRKQVMYVRNFGDGLGLPWQKVFQTADRATVEAYCRSAGIEFEWKDGDRLRTRQVRPAVARHPRTGEMVWFNQAALFHITALEPKVRQDLLTLFKPEDLPLNAYYGDGSPLEPSVVSEINGAYRQEMAGFPWQQGDILLLDNMLMAHGRAQFSGPRRIIVGMSEPCSWADVQAAGAESTTC